MADAILDELRDKGQAQRDRMAHRSRAHTQSISEIGPPPITSKQRAAGTRLRNKCRDNFELFNSEVFPNGTGINEFGHVQLNSIVRRSSTCKRQIHLIDIVPALTQNGLGSSNDFRLASPTPTDCLHLS
jgi:hypothetical protein